MRIEAIRTERVSECQSMEAFIDRFLPMLSERSVVAITSKVVSVCEGRLVPQNAISKTELIEREADRVLSTPTKEHDIVLTYKHRLLIPSAGIDESNGNGCYILYPQDPFQSACRIYTHLVQRHHLKECGVLITDSHTTPLRRGVTGIALAWWGFNPVVSYVGHPDLFGRPLKVTSINLGDALAVSTVLTMGESSECTPLAVATDIPHIVFDQQTHSAEDLCIDPHEDLYQPLLGFLQ